VGNFVFSCHYVFSGQKSPGVATLPPMLSYKAAVEEPIIDKQTEEVTTIATTASQPQSRSRLLTESQIAEYLELKR
jgi:hypothetical protein